MEDYEVFYYFWSDKCKSENNTKKVEFVKNKITPALIKRFHPRTIYTSVILFSSKII